MNNLFGNLKRRCEMDMEEQGVKFKDKRVNFNPECEAIIRVLSEEIEKLQNRIKDLEDGKDVQKISSRRS